MTTSPTPEPQPTDIRCIQCGYDLSGSAVGGLCPECGTPVAETLKPRLLPQSRDNSDATASVVFGVLGLLCCFIFPFMALFFGYRAVKLAPQRGNPPGAVATARVGIALGIAGIIIWIIRISKDLF